MYKDVCLTGLFLERDGQEVWVLGRWLLGLFGLVNLILLSLCPNTTQRREWC